MQIPSIEFIRLKPFTDNSGRTYLEADRGLGFSTRWHAVMIERDSVLEIWPEIKKSRAPAAERVSECYKNHGASIIQMLKEQSGRMPNKRQIAEQMREGHLTDVNLSTIMRNFSPRIDIAQRKAKKN